MPKFIVPDSNGEAEIKEFNPCHSPADGRFCDTGGGGVMHPEDHRKYFTMDAGTKLVPLATLVPRRARPDGIKRASEHMLAAYQGTGGRRKPISVRKKGSTYEILDGNSTYAVAKRSGWSSIPAHIKGE